MSSNRQTTSLSLQPLIGNVTTPAAAANAIIKSKSDHVRVDALVLLKILKHCQEMGGGAELAQGILTGMVQVQDNSSKRIEITNCFGLPHPSSSNLKNADYDEACNTLITDNLKTFRHLNNDHLIIGWYQSALFGTYVNKNFIEDHFMYQSDIEESIVLIYGYMLFFLFFFSLNCGRSLLETITTFRLTRSIQESARIHFPQGFSSHTNNDGDAKEEGLFPGRVSWQRSHLSNFKICF